MDFYILKMELWFYEKRNIKEKNHCNILFLNDLLQRKTFNIAVFFNKSDKSKMYSCCHPAVM